jgi:hypothetical protein
MLTLAACFAYTLALDTTPTAALPITPVEQRKDGPAIVADTVPFGNRFGFPFTREEYKRALRQILPEDDAEFQTRLIYEPDPEAIGYGIADFNLLLLAALSDAVAQRVIAYRPELRDAVLWVREDPEGFVAGLRGLPPSQ